MRRTAARSLVLALAIGVAGVALPSPASATTTDLVVTKTTWDETVSPGDMVEYEIEVANTTGAPITVDTITDDLPDGFTYQPGWTYGVVSDDPAISSGTLTWTIDQPVEADSSVILGFYAVAPETEGSYLNSASATAAGATVQGSGPTAAVEVDAYSATLNASAGHEEVDLDWFTDHPDASSARIFYQSGATAPAYENGTEVPVTAGQEYARVTGLANGTTYSFALFILDADGNVLEEASASATPEFLPMELDATSGDQQVQLYWLSNHPDLAGYEVRYQTGETPPTRSQGTSVDLDAPIAEETVVTGLTNGTKYSFTVFALDDAGAVLEQASASATPTLGPVEELQATGSGTGSIRLTWRNPPSGTGVIVRYSTVEYPATPADGTNVPVTAGAETVDVSGLVDGTTYYFSVWAVDGDAISEVSDVELAPFTCPDLTSALDAPTGLVVGTAWVACAGPNANRNDSTLATPLPRSGTQALMTSGDVAVAAPPSDGDNEGDELGTGTRGANDVSIFRIDLDVPAGTSCLSFDYAFASDEYPEYVGGSFNDGFLAELDVNDWSVEGNLITAPHNFARTADGSYVSVNSPVFEDGATVLTPEESNTGYDGFSQNLRASTPITPGQHSIYLSIFDAGDNSYDSAAFIDRLTVSPEACSEGTSIPPVAEDDEDHTAFETPVTTDVLANDNDPLNGILTVTGKTNGAHGTVSCTTTECTYTPGDGFSGEDSYTYTVSNAGGGTDTATVTITVDPAPVNQSPDAVNDSASTPSKTAKQINVLVNDTDPESDSLTITGETNGTNGTVDCTATACTYTPTGTFRGTDTFTYTISDGHGGTDTATVTMTVTNQGPDAVDDNGGTVGAGAGKAIPVLTNDTDPEDDNLTITAETDGTKGTVTCTATQCTYTAGGTAGSDSFTYTVSDGHGGTDTATVSITVVANAAPDAVDDSASTPSTTAKQVDVLTNDTDTDGDTLTITAKTNGTNGGVTCTSTACTYTPTGTFRGADSFTYTISDGHGGTDTATVNVTVTNRGPNAVDDNGGTVGAGTSKAIPVLTNDTDPEGDSLTISGKTNGSKGTVTCTSTSCTYTAAADAVGSDSFTYTISDGHGGTDTATVNVTVTAAAPGSVSIAIADTSLVWPEQAQVTGVLATANGTSLPGRSVDLWSKPDGGSWSKVGSTTSGAGGALALEHRPSRKSSYQWRVAGTTVKSDTAGVTVTPGVTTDSVTDALPYNRNLVVTGLSTPVDKGAAVQLQRKQGGSWTTVSTATFGAGSTGLSGGAPYKLKELMESSGTFTYRVNVPAQDGRKAIAGTPFTVSVYRANVAQFSKKGTEFITIKNIGQVSFDTTGWKLTTKSGNQAMLPARTVAPGATLKIFTGSGTSTSSVVYLGEGAMFHDVSDDVKLWDGAYLVLRHTY